MILRQPEIERDSQQQQQQQSSNSQNYQSEDQSNKENQYSNNRQLIEISSVKGNSNSSNDSPIKRLKLSNYSSNNQKKNNNSISQNLHYDQIVPQILRLAKDKKKLYPLKQSYLSQTKQHTLSTNQNNEYQNKNEQLKIDKQQQQYQSMSDPNQRRFFDLYRHQLTPKKHQDQENISKIEVEDNNEQQSANVKSITTEQQQQQQQPNESIIQFGQGLQSISERSQFSSNLLSNQQTDRFISAEDLLNDSINSSFKKNYRHQQQQQKQQNHLKTAQTTLIAPPNIAIYDNNKHLIKENSKNNNIKPNNQNKKERKLSFSISDSVLSPRFESHLNINKNQPQVNRFPSLLLNKSRRFGHNQYPQQQVYQSDTYPRCQPNIKGPRSRDSVITKKQLQLSLANNLDKILFKYSGGHAGVLYNNKLKIKNNSPVSVEVKILCTSPCNYDVRPISDIVLSPSQIMNFIIEMKLYMHDLDHVKMKHDLDRYRGDMFKICYWPSQYTPDIWYQQGEKILPVVIEDSQDQKIRNEGLLKNQTDDELKIAAGERDIEMYRKMIERNFLQVGQMQQEIKQLQKKRFWTGYFSKTAFILITIIGGAIGYWCG